MTSVASEFGEGNAAISLEIAIYAMLIVTPLQFIFELMCVTLQRLKVVNRDNTSEGLRLLIFQITVTGIFVYIIG
jgi:hypothetical protein